MKYYKSATGEVFAYEEDGSQDDFIQDGLIPITLDQLAQIREQQDAANAPTTEKLAAEAEVERDRLLAIAAIRVGPLQDAVDLGEATTEDEATLKSWKKYRVDVNRITSQSGFPDVIDWPAVPG